MKHRDIITTPRVEEMRREKKQSRFVRRIIFITIGFVVLIGIIVLSRIKPLLIDSVSVEGTRIIEAQEVEGIVSDMLRGSYVFLFPKNNSLIYPQKAIINTLLDSFPRIESVSVKRIDLRQLVVHVVEREGVYLWCGSEFPEPEGSHCYFMDTTGYVFSEAPYFSGNVYLRWYNGSNITESIIGDFGVSSINVSRVSLFVQQLKQIGVDIHTVSFLENETIAELYIDTPSRTHSPKIIIKTNDNLDLIFENISSSFYSDPMKNILVSTLR